MFLYCNVNFSWECTITSLWWGEGGKQAMGGCRQWAVGGGVGRASHRKEWQAIGRADGWQASHKTGRQVGEWRATGGGGWVVSKLQWGGKQVESHGRRADGRQGTGEGRATGWWGHSQYCFGAPESLRMIQDLQNGEIWIQGGSSQAEFGWVWITLNPN